MAQISLRIEDDVKKKAEAAKVAVRNIRRDANDVFKKQNKAGEITEDDLKKLEEETQKLTDKYVGQIDKSVEVNSKIMTFPGFVCYTLSCQKKIKRIF